MAKVLLADDEAKLRRLVGEVLVAAGHEVTRVETGTAALTALEEASFDVVVTDLMLPGANGLDVLARARLRPRPPDVILMTAYGSTENAVAAMKAGAADYLTKPFAMDELRLRVNRLAEHRAARRKSAQLLAQLTGTLVAESASMQDVLQQVAQVAPTETTVLLLGESGTGKSRIARHIHYQSRRSDEPYVEIHCASLSETMLESELFGHAPDTAGRGGEGLLARADGGTVLLDEIGDVPPDIQVKLLRFIEAQEFLPVGAVEPRRVNVRVIAASNRDIEAAVKAREFREDLYYRLNVFGITLPPLRARPEDVSALAETRLSSRGIPRSKLSEAARVRLVEYEWPGNVRELENVLERATILAGDGPIEPEHLGPAASREAGAPNQHLEDILGEGFNLDVFERDLVYKAIELAGGNKAAAARLLGITRRRLYSRLKSLGERTRGLVADE